MDQQTPHLLVVDDDDRLRALLSRYLREQGFIISTAANAAEARELLKLFVVDLMVLDVMMPQENGIEFARALRAGECAIPILILSARADVEDRMAGLEAGVDDYLTKPFEPRELLLRIHAILRRTRSDTPSGTYINFANCRFDTASMQLLCDGATVHITAAEAAMLKLLSGQAGTPISRETLAKDAGALSTRSVDVQVARLRKKLGAAAGARIQTVRGAGYVLHGDIP